MKIFITGATGFIGTHLARRLALADHALYCLVRRTSNIENLKSLGANLITGDITDRDSLLKGMSCCDAVINLAANVFFWQPDRQIYTNVNVEGTRNVMESALEMGIHKVVHVSSAAIYGEPSDCPFTEESPVGPYRRSEYTRTKYTGDLISWQLYEDRGLPLVVIYPGCVVGPGDPNPSSQQIKDFIQRQLAAPEADNSVVTYVHATDVIEVIVAALDKENNIGEKYLVGKYQLTFHEFDALISEISGEPFSGANLPDCLVLATAALLGGTKMSFDGSKAERELGLIYTSLRTTFEEAITSYQ